MENIDWKSRGESTLSFIPSFSIRIRARKFNKLENLRREHSNGKVSQIFTRLQNRRGGGFVHAGYSAEI